MTFISLVDGLNLRSADLARIAWPLLWQSSLLILGMFLLDQLLRRKIRPSVRHALWLVVLVKVLLPPSFASPTGIAWWLRPREAAPAKHAPVSYAVTYGPARTETPLPALTQIATPTPRSHMSREAWAFTGSGAISGALLIIMLARWARLRNHLGKLQTSPDIVAQVVRELRRRILYRGPVRLAVTDASISPALYGLFRPVIILPAPLLERLTPSQLRAVVLHELFHLRNGDVWINCFQSLLQIVFWWHPLLWLANARIRRIREEVVDDAVRLALGEEAETYAPTLLEVARLSLARPIATLGLVGILESRTALRQRVERMVNLPAPKQAGLTLGSLVGILAFTSVAMPMGQAPAKPVKIAIDGKPQLYYTFDKTFADYFGSNGVEAVSKALTEMNAASKFERYTADLSRFDASTPESDQSAAEPKGGIAETDQSWQIRPLGETGHIEFDISSGTVTATNGAMISFGDKSLSADKITANRDTGEIAAVGSPRLQLGARETQTPRPALNFTNVQLAQVQPSAERPTRIFTSKARNAILNKLQTIRLNNVTFDNLPLSEVINYLRDEAKKRDPEGKGINFLLYPFTDTPRSPGAIDPATGLAVATPEAEPADIGAVTIRLVPPLNDVRLVDVLDAITKVADKRIRYTLEEYGVAFRLAGNESPVPMFTRTIKIDPNTFAQGLESVAGVSIGGFQTGGQGGGGGQQGNAGGITIPRVQVAPNSGIGGQGGQSGGAQGGTGGGISGGTRPTASIRADAVRQFIASLGVDLTPPKSFFYTYGEGSLLIHATKADIDTIEKAISAFPAAPAPAVGGSKIGTPTNSISVRTNQTKLPVLGDLPIVGRAFTRTVELSSATSPAAQVSRISQDPNAKLYTRTMKPDMNFFAGVQKRSGLSPNASLTELQKGFLALLPDAGIRLSSAELVAFVDHGKLLVRATKENMDAIEAEVLSLSVPPPQVTIKANFVEVPKGDAQYLLSRLNQLRLQDPIGNAAVKQMSNSDASFAEAMTDSQFRALLAEAKQRSGADLLSEASVTTLSGRQAQIQMVDMKTILLKINPQALTTPGVTSSNIYVTENLALGPVLDVTPVVAEDGLNISLNVTATVTGFVGYDALADSQKVQVFVDGRPETAKPPLPHLRTRQVQMAATITDGQTLLLHNPRDVTFSYDKDGNGTPEESTAKEDLLVFVTTTIIDSAGNPVHSSAGPNQK